MNRIIVELLTLITEISGKKIKTSENTAYSCAVSLTEWDSLQSHAKFVHKESSASFFAASKTLSKGPPNISHYSFGNLRALVDSECSRFIFSKGGPLISGPAEGGAICAESIERPGIFCTLGPVNEGAGITQSDYERQFDVQWYSYERKVRQPSL